MHVTIDDLRKIASLACVRIDRRRERDHVAQMEEMIHFAGDLGGPARAGRSPHAAPVREAPDEPRQGLSRDVVLANAPDHRRGHVRMPPLGSAPGEPFGSAGVRAGGRERRDLGAAARRRARLTGAAGLAR